MKRHVLIAGVLAVLAGCGGDPGPDLEPGPTVQRWLDEGDCSVLTEGYARTNFESRGPCEDSPFEGLRAGDYTIAGTKVTGDEATVTIRPRDGGPRAYTLQDTEDGWRIDRYEDLPITGTKRLGQPYRWIAGVYDRDDQAINARLTFTPESTGVSRDFDGDSWVKVRIRSASDGPVIVFFEDFAGIVREPLDRVGNAYWADGQETILPGSDAVYELRFKTFEGQRLRRLRYAPTGGEPVVWDLAAPR